MALALSAGHLAAQDATAAAGRAAPPYVVDAAPAEPRLFAAGVVSTPDNEFGGVFTPGGTEFYFTKSVPRSYFYMICVSRFRNGRWSAPDVAPFSGRYRDFDAVISPDGSRLFFTSDRPVDGRPKTDYDLWVVDRTPDGWGEPRNLGAPVNTDSNEWFASVTAAGPARLNGLYPRKGTIAPGAGADLVILDPARTRQLRAADLHMETDYSPYEGMEKIGRAHV
jgi:hypothetical protein